MSRKIDHSLVGDFIAYEQQYHLKDTTDFANQLRVSRSTVYRLYDGDPSIKAATYRKAEALLDLPEYTLDLVREQDLGALNLSGLEERPMRWLSQRLGGKAAAPGARSQKRA